jgi:hypothetical protein
MIPLFSDCVRRPEFPGAADFMVSGRYRQMRTPYGTGIGENFLTEPSRTL